MELQHLASICPDGVGNWYFFWLPFDLGFSSKPATFAYVLSIVDVAWDAARLVSEPARALLTLSEGRSFEFQLGFDARVWVFRQVVDSIVAFFGTRWVVDWTRLYQVIKPCMVVFKFLVWLYVLLSVEMIVIGNALTTEDAWNFGQIFAMANTFGLWCVLLMRIFSSRGARKTVVGIAKGSIYIPAFLVVAAGGLFSFMYSHELFHRMYPLDKPWSGTICLPVSLVLAGIGLFGGVVVLSVPISVVYLIFLVLRRWIGLIVQNVAVLQYAFDIEILDERPGGGN